MALNNNLKISLLQSDIKWEDKVANLANLKSQLQYRPIGTDIVVTPELFTTGFITAESDQIASLAETNSESTIETIEKLSEEFSCAIAGSFLAKSDDKYYNRGFFIEPSGEKAFYNKRHLFTMGKEHESYSAGNTLPPVIRYRGWNIMLVVCYDLRFPEWCRNTNNKYDLLIVVANWPKSREYAWTQLLIARAIENQCYVCGVNRTGVDGYGFEYPDDSSFVVDYKGTILKSSSNQDNNLKNYVLDLDLMNKFKNKFPAWRDADNFKIEL